MEWTEIHANGGTTNDSLDFLNTRTAKSRDAQGIISDLPPGHQAAIYDFATGKRIQ